MPLNKRHPPGVTNQSLPGLGEVLLDATDRDVPDLHLHTDGADGSLYLCTFQLTKRWHGAYGAVL